MSKPKFCIDCKHYDFTPFMYMCNVHKEPVDIYDLVSGRLMVARGDNKPVYCNSMRLVQAECGKEGRLFEARK